MKISLEKVADISKRNLDKAANAVFFCKKKKDIVACEFCDDFIGCKRRLKYKKAKSNLYIRNGTQE
jgi:hypothetical protein